MHNFHQLLLCGLTIHLVIYEAESVRALGLRDAKDPEIFVETKKADAVVMSKDDDFIQLIEQRSAPPKLIWVICGNTSNARMREFLSTTLLKAKELDEVADYISLDNPIATKNLVREVFKRVKQLTHYPKRFC